MRDDRLMNSVISKYAREVKLDGKDLLIMKESDIMGIMG